MLHTLKHRHVDKNVEPDIGVALDNLKGNLKFKMARALECLLNDISSPFDIKVYDIDKDLGLVTCYTVLDNGTDKDVSDDLVKALFDKCSKLGYTSLSLFIIVDDEVDNIICESDYDNEAVVTRVGYTSCGLYFRQQLDAVDTNYSKKEVDVESMGYTKAEIEKKVREQAEKFIMVNSVDGLYRNSYVWRVKANMTGNVWNIFIEFHIGRDLYLTTPTSVANSLYKVVKGVCSHARYTIKVVANNKVEEIDY